MSSQFLLVVSFLIFDTSWSSMVPDTLARDKMLSTINIYPNIIINFDLIINDKVGFYSIPTERWGRIFAIGFRSAYRMPLVEFKPESTELVVRFSNILSHNDGFSIHSNLTLHDTHHIQMIFDERDNFIVKINGTTYINESHYKHLTGNNMPIYACTYSADGDLLSKDVICSNTIISNFNITSYDSSDIDKNMDSYSYPGSWSIKPDPVQPQPKDIEKITLWSVIASLTVGYIILATVIIRDKYTRNKSGLSNRNDVNIDSLSETSVNDIENQMTPTPYPYEHETSSYALNNVK